MTTWVVCPSFSDLWPQYNMLRTPKHVVFSTTSQGLTTYSLTFIYNSLLYWANNRIMEIRRIIHCAEEWMRCGWIHPAGPIRNSNLHLIGPRSPNIREWKRFPRVGFGQQSFVRVWVDWFSHLHPFLRQWTSFHLQVSKVSKARPPEAWSPLLQVLHVLEKKLSKVFT